MASQPPSSAALAAAAASVSAAGTPSAFAAATSSGAFPTGYEVNIEFSHLEIGGLPDQEESIRIMRVGRDECNRRLQSIDNSVDSDFQWEKLNQMKLILL